MTFVASGLCRRNAEPNFGFIPQPAHGFGVLKFCTHPGSVVCITERVNVQRLTEPKVLLLKLQ